MKFAIDCHKVDSPSENVHYTFDNEKNKIYKDNGKPLYLWTNPKFEGIKENKYLPADGTFDSDRPLTKSNLINALKIQLGLKCNYNCSYCSQAATRQTDKDAKFPSEEVINSFFEKLDKMDVQLWETGRIELWGGEPLVYWKALKHLIPELRVRYPKAGISMVTNGSLLTREIVDFLCENKVHVTISHDGPGFNLRHEKDPLLDEDTSIKDVWLYLFEESKKIGMPMGFNVVITPANYNLYKIRDFFKKNFHEDASFGFEGVVNYHSDAQSLVIFDKEKKAEFNQIVFDILTQEWDDPHWNSLRNRAVGMLETIIYNTKSKRFSAKCESTSENVLPINLDGTVLSCQNCDPKDFGLGNIEDLKTLTNEKFTHWSKRPHCKECFLLCGCKGGCPYLNEKEHVVTCRNERLLWASIFAAVWWHLTETVIDNITPITD